MFYQGAQWYSVTIGGGKKRVQLPNGFAYDEGETVVLTERQVEQIDESAFDEGFLTDLTPFRAIRVGQELYASYKIESFDVTPGEPSADATETQQFTAEITLDDENDTTIDITTEVVWESLDEDVATIDDAGLATALTDGTAGIRATFGAVRKTVDLEVNGIASLAVTPEEPSVAHEGTEQFTATATFEDDSESNVSAKVVWTSSDEDVATVDDEGLATTVGAGEAEITATWGEVSDSATMTVTD